MKKKKPLKKRNKKKKKEKRKPWTKRFGELFLKLSLSLIVFKILLYLYRFSEPLIFSNLNLRLNILILSCLFLGIIFCLPYDKGVYNLRKWALNLEIKKQEEYTKIVIDYFFILSIVVYITFLLLSRFREISSNFNYFLVIIFFLGVLSSVFPDKKNTLTIKRKNLK